MTAILLTLVILSGCNKGKSIKEHNELGYVYPIPQNYSYNDHNIPDISKVKIVCPEDIDSVTLNDLKQYLKESKKSTVTIHIGLNNNPDIEYELTKAGLEKQIKPEGYILYAKDNKIIMSGSDNRGIYYALQSFKMLAENKRIKETNISDYPQIPVRGVIEGFYGEPWSHKDRLSLLDFFGNIKMNTYIYAPKDDPKHRSAWREEYTTEEIKLMKELIEKANSNHVDFVFSVSPGNDIRFDVNYSNDFQALVKKTESMYDIGIRSFAIFLDDIVKKNADNHAKLVNDYQGYLNTKEGVKPLICIFTEYTTPMYTKAYTDKISSLLNRNFQRESVSFATNNKG